MEPDYIFQSSLFNIEEGEDENTNPYLFGRELANWLCDQLLIRGYDVDEVFAEDWGWCLMCQTEPYQLYVGCTSILNENLVQRCKDPKSEAEILWHVITFSEKLLIARLWRKIDTKPGLNRLNGDLQDILNSNPSISWADKNALEEAECFFKDFTDDIYPEIVEPKPVSRWISVPLGMLLLPILFLCAIGGISLFLDTPPEYAVIRPIIGTVILLGCFLLGVSVIRMIFSSPSSLGGLFPPMVLRGIALLFLLLPLGGLFTGYYIEKPVAGVLQTIVYFVVFNALWQLARYRELRGNSNADDDNT